MYCLEPPGSGENRAVEAKKRAASIVVDFQSPRQADPASKKGTGIMTPVGLREMD
jgi:hypothetical protein